MQPHEALAHKICALLEAFRAALENFIHTREYCRAFYWEQELARFLRAWKRRGILINESQEQNLRTLLADLRTELIPAEQLQAMREHAAHIAALHRTWTGPIELGEPKSPEEALVTPGMRQFGYDLMRRNPPERWLERVTAWCQKLPLTDEMRTQFWAWMAQEQTAALAASGESAPAITEVAVAGDQGEAPAGQSAPQQPQAAQPAPDGEPDAAPHAGGRSDIGPRAAGFFSEPEYGTKEWFALLVRTRESYQYREGLRVGMKLKDIEENLEKRVRQNAAGMFDAAWKLANELLTAKRVEDKDLAIRIAAVVTYRRFYPPNVPGSMPPGEETLAEIAYWDSKARQILAGQGPLSRFFEGLLLPASVNPQGLNLENILTSVGGFVGAPGRGGSPKTMARVRRSGTRSGALPNKTPPGKIGGGSKPRQGGKLQPRPAPSKKPIDESRPQHGNVAHDATAYNIGKAWEADPATVAVRFNQELVDTRGNRISGLRPDVQRIRRTSDGRLVVDVTEIRSPRQTDAQMDAKKVQYLKILKGQAGVIDWDEPADVARDNLP